jgi:hypothetical protein
MKTVSRLVLLSATLVLCGCGTIDLPSIDLPWETPAAKPLAPPPATIALRGDSGDTAAALPDGLQVEDLRTPFGAQPAQTSAALTDGMRRGL